MSLTAPERVVALAVARRQDQVRSHLVQRVERRFGPDGIALLAAGLAWFTVGEFLAIAGVVVLPLSGGVVLGCCLFAVVVVFIVVAAVRVEQGLRAGRAFRLSG